jgi:hypothetical protein
MAPSDISLSRVAHNPHAPLRTAVPTPTQTTPASSAPAATAPSFTAVFAAIAAAAAAAGTTAVTVAPAPGVSTANAASAIPAAAASATPTAAASATPADDPAGPLFGADPWVADPTGSGPGPVTHYNPIYFATAQTAQTVAQMVGGTVTSTQVFTSAPGSPFQQNEPNLMVQLPNGGLINPGLVADIYTHGWNQAFENQQVANEVAGAVPTSTNG